MLLNNIKPAKYSTLEPDLFGFIVECAKEIGVLRATCYMHGIKAIFSGDGDFWFATKPFLDNLESRDLPKFKHDMHISFTQNDKNKKDVNLQKLKENLFNKPVENHKIINGKDLIKLIVLAENGNNPRAVSRQKSEQMSKRIFDIAIQDFSVLRNSSLGRNLANLCIWEDYD